MFTSSSRSADDRKLVIYDQGPQAPSHPSSLPMDLVRQASHQFTLPTCGLVVWWLRWCDMIGELLCVDRETTRAKGVENVAKGIACNIEIYDFS